MDARLLYGAYGLTEGLPVVGSVLKRARHELERGVSLLVEKVVRDHVDVDAIVAQLAIDDVVARLEIDDIVSRLDIHEVVARLDIDEVVARLDIDTVVERLDVDEVLARIDFGRLAGRVIDVMDLPRMVRQSATSLVRSRRPQDEP